MIWKVLSPSRLQKMLKCALETGPRVWLDILLLKEIRGVTHGPNQPMEQKPEIEMGLSRKDLWRKLLSNGVGLLIQLGEPQVFETKNTFSWNEGE